LYAKFVSTVFKSRKLIDDNRYGNENWAETSRDVMKAIESVGGRFEISGIENLRRAEGPLVIVANHMSALETFVLPCLVTLIKPTTFVVKEKLMRGVFFGKIMKSRDPIVVGRENAREDMEIVLREGERILRGGKSVILFPEGTRQADFKPENFNSLGTKLAKRAGVNILPVALKTDFWSNGRILKGFGPLKRRRRIHIAFGEAMPVEKKEKETHQKIIEFISSKFAAWKSA
ncbi:MAG TPA: lysophospholipid acyltransferase family protein, partial [Turneriella sp.]|nr:lysophospholipid acyltransferase family protein [Turneriella sp.]